MFALAVSGFIQTGHILGLASSILFFLKVSFSHINLMQYSRFVSIFCTCTRIFQNVSHIFVCRIMKWTEKHDCVFLSRNNLCKLGEHKEEIYSAKCFVAKSGEYLKQYHRSCFFIWINAQFETMLGFDPTI